MCEAKTHSGQNLPDDAMLVFALGRERPQPVVWVAPRVGIAGITMADQDELHSQPH